MPIQLFNPLFEKYSPKQRRNKIEEFFHLMDPMKMIYSSMFGGRGHGFRGIWNHFERIIAIGINEKAVEDVRKELKHAEVIVGDACNLPLNNKDVDYVFSNALLEHIPKGRTCLFALEVKRVVRKGYFIATPNYYFPYKPHYKSHFDNIYLRELKRD